MSGQPTSGTLGSDVFVALAAVAWADGTLDPDEADAIVRAAVDLGVELGDIAAIEEATRVAVPLSDVNVAKLSKDDRLFVYGIACWIAQLDGKVTHEESTTLDGLAERLEAPGRARAHAEKRAAEVAQMPEGDRPARYDLDKLRALLRA